MWSRSPDICWRCAFDLRTSRLHNVRQLDSILASQRRHRSTPTDGRRKLSRFAVPGTLSAKTHARHAHTDRPIDGLVGGNSNGRNNVAPPVRTALRNESAASKEKSPLSRPKISFTPIDTGYAHVASPRGQYYGSNTQRPKSASPPLSPRPGQNLGERNPGRQRTLPRGARPSSPLSTSKAGDVPFEGLPWQNRVAEIGPSTTRPERAVFARLEKLRAPPIPTTSMPKTDLTSAIIQSQSVPKPSKIRSKIDAILDEVSLEESRRTKVGPITSPSITASTDVSQPSVTGPSRDMRPLDQAKLRRLVDTAKTDLEIWEIMKRHVFGPVAALRLETSTPGAKQVALGALGKLGQTFSGILSHIAHVLRECYPSSPVQLAIIPELHRAGSTAFALGASTSLYNEALDHLINQEQDMPGTLELLEEMEREVIEPDEQTLALVDKLRSTMRLMRQGSFGGAAEAVMYADRYRTLLGQLHSKAMKIRSQLQPSPVSQPVKISSSESKGQHRVVSIPN